MKKGFLYLVAVMGWYSRKVLSWQLSNSMDPEFYMAAEEEALAKYGKPDISTRIRGASSPEDFGRESSTAS